MSASAIPGTAEAEPAARVPSRWPGAAARDRGWR